MNYHNPYGPKLDEYLSLRRLGAGVFLSVTEAPCEHKLQAAIESLCSSDNVHCETFETILSMERTPTCAYLYLLLSDVKVFPSCIRLLRAYCQEGRGILDHAYGFLCLQVMALSVEIAKLNQAKQLDIVLQILTQAAVQFPAFDLLSHYSRKLEINEFCEDEYLRPSPQLLGWHTDPDTRLETCLTCIGGCNIQDVQFLVDELWYARSLLLEASEYAAGTFPGWCGLFYVMHDTLVKVFGNFTRRSETSKERTYWIHLLEVMRRYSVYSEASEDSSLSFLLRDCPQFAETSETSVTTPVESARVVKAYIDKIGRLPTFKYAYVTRLYGFACANYHVDAARSNEHLTNICAASLEEYWAELLRANRLDVGQWYQLSNTIAATSTMLLTWRNHPVNESLLLSILTHVDFFELLGRMILFPMSIDGETFGSKCFTVFPRLLIP
ncbi:hypothetical protein ACGC1H_003109 [Rhizoctonia solani]|uniref:Uncharacterized protein n=1 Tax=Rhizoctonia solani TaxID=456999 RepID=A0A8H2WNF1_9AGAM|nr:unnamed protein product [Rhizoctonia solani]